MDEDSRSCQNCPSLVPAQDVRELIGTNFGPGVDYCMTRGIPLHRGVSQAEAERRETMVAIAAKCMSYQKLPPARPAQVSARVGYPSKAPTPRGSHEVQPSNCKDCAYLAPITSVRSRIGWTQPICVARGILLPGRRMAQECKGCVFGVVAGSADPNLSADRPTLDDFELDDYFNFKMPEQVDSSVAVAHADPLPDPAKYVTDQPVTASDEADGIRAWRRIQHPTNARKREVFLPVFDPQFFEQSEQDLIPQAGTHTRPELYSDYGNLVHACGVSLVTGRMPALLGHAGVGKTDLFVHLAWLCQLPFARLSITQATEVTDIIGKHLVQIDPATNEAVTRWVDGKLPARLRKPGVLCIDEPNAGPDEIWTAIRPLADGADALVLEQDEGQIVYKNPWCLPGMAMNPDWDPRYTGLAKLSEADGNRLDSIWVDYPAREIEETVIVLKCNAEGFKISKNEVATVLDVGKEIREMADPENGGQLTISWGLRLSIEVARKLEYLDMEDAFARVLGDRLDPDQRELVMRVIKSHSTTGAK